VIAAAFTGLAVLLTIAATSAFLLLGRLDNRLGDDMLLDPRMTLAMRIQRWLGIDHLHTHLQRIEADMAKVIDLFNGLVAQEAAASAAQATSFHNIDVAFAKLQDAIANGDASPEVQAAADQLAAGFASLQKAAEDEGKLYEPADDNGDQPADGGDTPVDNGGDVPDSGDTGDVPPVVNSRS
jgi:hypothetical protein